MNAIKKALTSWWFVSITIALIVAVALIILAPMVMSFLRPWWVRLIIGLVILAIWGGLTIWHLMTAKRNADALVAGLEKVSSDGGEGDTLALRMKEALVSLKNATGKQSNYLYSRPWFVIIGPPGAGKTTALVNSGLRFPFSDTVLKGSGGTRNLDFWFADEAVFVDTAGRYTSQDSSAERDAGGWNSFLGLLKKNRPTQPVNGVLVAIGVDTLINSDTKALDEAAGIVRRRVQELQAALEISVPVYVMFTKADLISGFIEFFEDLDVDGRRAVLGATVTYDPTKTPDDELLINEFDDMAMALEDRVSKRLQDDLDAKRRSLIVGFPGQIGALRSRVLRFLAGAFPQSTTDETAILRGFYFTSGVQSGTPFDRLLGDLASLYEARPNRGEQGRAYFINRLLTEVVFGEGGLVRASKKGARRELMNLTAWLAGIAGVCALIFILWMVSFFLNQGFQGQLFKQAQAAAAQLTQSGADLREVREKDAAMTDILPALEALRNLPQGYAQRHDKGAPFFMTFGLYQASDSREAQQTYLQALDRTVLPRVLLRLEDVLHDPQATPLTLYPALKTYLLLGGQGPKMDAKDVKAWIMNDYANGELSGAENDDNRNQMSRHLDAMLADPNMNQVWANGQAPVDAQLIHDVRIKIGSMSLVDRAYSILIQNANGAGPDWRAGDLVDSGGLNAFSDPQTVQNVHVPFIYTRDGFKSSFNSGLIAVATKLRSESWVLGQEESASTVNAQMSSLKDDLTNRYAQDYIAQWEAVIAAIQPANYFGNPLAQSAIASQNSPVKTLFLEIRKNTAFEKTSGDALQQGATTMAISHLAPSQIRGALLSKNGISASKIISDHFSGVDDWVVNGLDPFMQALRDAVKANGMQQAAGGGLGAEGATTQALSAQANLSSAASGAPPQVQGFTAAASKAGGAAQVSASQAGMADQYNGQLAATCQMATNNKYPFSTAATADASIADMRSLFASNGSFDQLIKGKLAPLIDTSGPIWHWKADQPLAQGFSPTSAEALQTATQIRDFLDSGMQGTIELAGVGGTVKKAEFAAGPPGQTYTFDPAAPGQPQPFQWSVPPFESAHVRLIGANGDIKMISTTGPWALLRLVGQSQLSNSGPVAMIAQFGDATNYARFRIVLNGAVNPFRHGGMWAFRCPPSL